MDQMISYSDLIATRPAKKVRGEPPRREFVERNIYRYSTKRGVTYSVKVSIHSVSHYMGGIPSLDLAREVRTRLENQRETILARQVARSVAYRTPRGADGLTMHERRVVAMLAKDMPKKRIADALGISDKAVSVALKKVRQALGVATTEGIVIEAFKRGILDRGIIAPE